MWTLWLGAWPPPAQSTPLGILSIHLSNPRKRGALFLVSHDDRLTLLLCSTCYAVVYVYQLTANITAHHGSSMFLYPVLPKCLLQSSINISRKKYHNLFYSFQQDSYIYHWFLPRVINRNLISGDTVRRLFFLPGRHPSNGMVMNSSQHFINV